MHSRLWVGEVESVDIRVESDLLGAKEIPAHAYWGVHTAPRRGELPDHRNRDGIPAS